VFKCLQQLSELTKAAELGLMLLAILMMTATQILRLSLLLRRVALRRRNLDVYRRGGAFSHEFAIFIRLLDKRHPQLAVFVAWLPR
jgi:hypothetical protein